MNINFDAFLEIVKHLNLHDIKELCKSNSQYMRWCREFKHIIFKDIVYVLSYTEFQVGNPEETIKTEIINVFKDINYAKKIMHKIINRKKINLEIENHNDITYALSFNETAVKYTLNEDNGSDTDRIFIWRIHTKKII